MADSGCQPTSMAFVQACQSLGIRQDFTSYSNPEGSVETEPLMHSRKEEFICLREWKSPVELVSKVGTWIEQYTSGYLHSSLSYKTPTHYERECYIRHGTQLAAT